MHPTPFMSGRRVAVLAALALATATGTQTAAAHAGQPVPLPSSGAYAMTVGVLTGPAHTDVTLRFTVTAGHAPVTTVKHVLITTFTEAGMTDHVTNLHDVATPDGIANVALDPVDRGLRIDIQAQIQTGTPPRTYVLRDTTQSLMRPDLVVSALHAPLQTLTTQPVDVTADVAEVNGDTGATAQVTLAGPLGPLADPVAVTVPAGGHVSVTFPGIALTTPVPVEVTALVTDVAPDEYDATNDTRSATVDVTSSQLASPYRVLFPSLVGYGAQFGDHVYAPITPWPPGQDHADADAKVKALEPQLVRIFYNDNWDANANGKFPDYATNYASFVKVAQLAQDTGATIEISYQNLGNVLTGPAGPPMAKYADVLQDLVVNHGLTNVRWAEVGNEPNSGSVTFAQYNALYRALNAELVARGLRSQIQLMGAGLVENGGNQARDHYSWLSQMGASMNDVLDGYAEHVYWFYYDPGRLEYRLRDSLHALDALPAEQQKPLYMMEFGIRGNDTCGTKPTFKYLYYAADPTCPEIWRTNIAGFQQLWFNIDSAQLGVAGTSKWDAYWSRYDNSSAGNQLFWMIGPPTEGSPLTPTYYAMSLLFHTTAPGWQIVGVDPWDSSDWSVPVFRQNLGDTTDDQPEQELTAYAGPSGELTVVGLDTHGKSLNVASTDPSSSYSIGGLPANTTFTLAEWNATGDGTNSIAGLVTTNAAGVARFDVPLQAAFSLTTVSVS